MDDDEIIERAMEAGWDLTDLLDECRVCGDLIYDDTCSCTVERRIPPPRRDDDA